MKRRSVVLVIMLLATSVPICLVSRDILAEEKSSPDFEERLSHVKKLYDDKLFEDAYPEAKKIAQEYEQEPKAWFWLGVIAHVREQYEEALTAYTKVIDLEPDYVNAYNNIGDLYERQGKWDEAIEYYEKALKVNPDYAVVHMGLGDTYLKKGELAKALSYYEKAVELYYEQGKFVEAYELAEKLLEADRQNPEGWLWFGTAARANNDDEKALEAYLKAVQLKPDYTEAYIKLGNLHERQRKWREAAEYYEKALGIDPNSAASYAGLGNIYRKNGVWAKAVHNYEKAVKLDPADDLSKSFLRLCRQALREKEDGGVISARTLGDIAWEEPRIRSRAMEADGRFFDGESPDAARVPLHIEFGHNKYALFDLSDNGRKQLKQAAIALRSPGWQMGKIVIEGHTCSCGSRDYNKALSHKRAETVRDYLIEQGIMKAEDILVSPRGEDEPISESPYENLSPERCEEDDIHSMNRRVVIREYRDEDGELLSEYQPANPRTSPTPESSASAKLSFWYRKTSDDPDGQFQRLTNGAVLHSGDEVMLFVKAYNPMHAYIFHHNSSGDWVCLFPNERFCKEAPAKNPLDPDRKYWLPGFGRGMPLDDVPGVERLIVYLSTDPDLDLEKIETEIPSTLGDGRNEVATDVRTRGLGGITVDKPEDVHLPANWYARIEFQHEP